MRTADLCAEFERIRISERPPGLGEDFEAVVAGGLVGYTTISVDGARYVPDRCGAPAFITPVTAMTGGLGPIQEAPSHRGHTADLVAWHPAHPDRWAVRAGAGVCLGFVAWWEVEKPVRLWRAPMAWLRARCEGLVLLTTDPVEAHMVLMQLRHGIIVEDRRHAGEVRAICERPYPSPPIIVPR